MTVPKVIIQEFVARDVDDDSGSDKEE